MYVCMYVCIFFTVLYLGSLFQNFWASPLQFYIDFIILTFASIVKYHKAPNLSNQPQNTLTSIYVLLCKNTFVLLLLCKFTQFL